MALLHPLLAEANRRPAAERAERARAAGEGPPLSLAACDSQRAAEGILFGNYVKLLKILGVNQRARHGVCRAGHAPKIA